MSAAQPLQADPEPVLSEVEAALAYHQGDAAATIATLLEDLKFLKGQLAIADSALSRGLTRGWEPKYERD